MMDRQTERAYFHSPFSFVRGQDAELAAAVSAGLEKSEAAGQLTRIGDSARFYLRYLAWDTEFFGCPTYRLDLANWDDEVSDPVAELSVVIAQLQADLRARHGRYYLFAELPAEDLAALQALGQSGLRLVETRLTYFHDALASFSWPERFAVRDATVADIPALRRVAMTTRNAFDRYHADPFYGYPEADRYLGTYVENSVKGFADLVLVPDEPEPAAFFTIELIRPEKSAIGKKLGHVALVAVAPERQGWHLKLMAEATYRFALENVQLAYMTTQATNRAVIRNCEKLGWRFGRTTHILAAYQGQD